MSERQRHALMILAVVLISLTLLAAPARGGDWWGVHIGSGGFGLSFGSTDWDVWGPSWWSPSWSVDYHVALSGYGEWVWVDGLGQCWMPWVTPSWRPFTYGRWVWTAFGWTWVAYEPWGYFPHHFGNWAMAPVGWVWVPGTSYHAANVVWVSSDAWIGWYPVPPPGWRHHHHGHHGGWDDGWRDARYATYVGWRDLGSDDLSRRSFGADAVRARAPRAVLRDAVAAPDRHELGRRGVEIPEMSLERRTARIDGREVLLARPREAASDVERNAGRAVERALAPQAVGTVSRRAAADAAIAATRVRTAPGAAREVAGRGGRPEPQRAAARGDGSGGPRSATAPAVRSAQTARSASPRSAAATASTGTRSRSRSGGEADRRAAARAAESHGSRSEERARRGEAADDGEKDAARRPSSRRPR